MLGTFTQRCIKKLLTATVTGMVLGCLPAGVLAQSLDEAVARQLATDSLGVACRELLGTNDPRIVLNGGLKTICSRTTAMGIGVNPANASGGGAGTPTSLPSVVEKRLDRARENDETKDEGQTKGNKPADQTWDFGRWSAYISGEYERLDKDVTDFEDGYDSDIKRFTIGGDLQLTERSLLGVAFVTSDQNGDFDGSGKFDVDSYGIVAYGSIVPIDRMFIQFSGSYLRRYHERERAAVFNSPNDPGSPTYTGSPEADFDANEVGLGIAAGYDVTFGKVTINPQVGLDWIKTTYDEYSETDISGLGLTFHDEDVTSLQTMVGIQASTAISTSFGVVSPQAGLSWRHEFQNDQREPEVSFTDDSRGKRFTYQTERPDRDFFEVSAGLVVVLPRGLQAFANCRAMLGHSYYSNYAGTVGLRMEF